MNPLWAVSRAGFSLFGAETAHELSLIALEAGVYPREEANGPRLAQKLFGLTFPNPIGIAAGYDKDARVYNQLLRMGFGFAEIGTVTPLPQPGNLKPRIFRLSEDRAIINRLGFNNQGHMPALRRLKATPPAGVVGVNLGASKTSTDPIQDYVDGIRLFAPAVSYITMNISSPNTPGLRDLQSPEKISGLLAAIISERDRVEGEKRVPVLIKLAPDIADNAIPELAAILTHSGVDGVILTNTTLDRKSLTSNRHSSETGGLSGPPLFAKSTRLLARFYMATEGRLPLIGVGGIASGEDAVDKIEAGASLMQLYTGLVYEGPGLLRRIKQTLSNKMDSTGMALQEMRGRKADHWASRPL
jgi:dihydroorotate dehydrogenase